MNEVETIEKEFYTLLYNFYKTLRNNKGYLYPIQASYAVLKFLDKNKDKLQGINKTDIHNLLMLSRVLIREEQKHRAKYNLNKTKREIIAKYLEDLAYLENESVKR